MNDTTFNGFRPNEKRVYSRPLDPKDQGHSVRQNWQRRKGSSFTFIYGMVCQCGKEYTGRTSSTPFYSYLRHLRQEGVDL